MHWDQIQENWHRLHWNVKEQWGKFSDADLDQIAGNRNALAARIEARYGFTRAAAELQISAWQMRRKDFDPVAKPRISPPA